MTDEEIKTLKGIAYEALVAWDSDRDSRVGKILAALAGRLPRYRSDIDALLLGAGPQTGWHRLQYLITTWRERAAAPSIESADSELSVQRCADELKHEMDVVIGGIDMAGIDRIGVDEPGRSEAQEVVWYGPHACAICGETIVKAARESGGAEFDPPKHLMRVFQRGSESCVPEIVYPAIWTPHVHNPDSHPSDPSVAPPGLTQGEKS